MSDVKSSRERGRFTFAEVVGFGEEKKARSVVGGQLKKKWSSRCGRNMQEVYKHKEDSTNEINRQFREARVDGLRPTSSRKEKKKRER